MNVKKDLQRAVVFLLLSGLFPVRMIAQHHGYQPLHVNDSVYSLSAKQLIAPAVMIGYGFAGFSMKPVRDLNISLRDEITERVSSPFKIDNVTLFAPVGLAYGLNLAGIKGRHDFFDRSVIFAASIILVEGSVQTIKYLGQVERPDGSNCYSFPSNHTAIAFAGAEFLYQEYKDVSVWYGIAGYSLAAGTGFLRIYNNKHWLTDVVAGAGFGIISTKIAYWLFPKIKKTVWKDMQINVSLVPGFAYHNGTIQ